MAGLLTRRDMMTSTGALIGGLALARAGLGQESGKELKAGLIGLDTSHVVAFTKALNNPNKSADLAGVRVVAGYPGGTDIPVSKDRVAKFTETLKSQYGLEIVDSIDALLKKVDVVLLESVDGRPHLEQARPVLKANKPVFIDKPIANSLADAVQIFELAQASKTPCFSSSALRFAPGVQAIRNDPKVGAIVGCDAYGPCEIMPPFGDLFWYGIHGVEILFTLMGAGCTSVTRVHTPSADKVAGTWEGGRIGTYRGLRGGKSEFGATVFGTKGIAQSGGSGGYEPLLVQICKFFKTGQPPVSAEETLNLIAFMEAADVSKEQGGKPVAIADLMTKARKG
jgi:predicted dehydrogenase